MAKPIQALKRFFTLITLPLTILFSYGEGDEINNTCREPLGTDSKTVTHDNWTCFLDDFNECFPPEPYSGYLRAHKENGKVKEKYTEVAIGIRMFK